MWIGIFSRVVAPRPNNAIPEWRVRIESSLASKKSLAVSGVSRVGMRSRPDMSHDWGSMHGCLRLKLDTLT